MKFCTGGSRAQQTAFSDIGKEGVLRNQNITMSIQLCERQWLVKDGYCFRERETELRRRRGVRVKEEFKRRKIKETKLESNNEIEQWRYEEGEKIKEGRVGVGTGGVRA